MSLGVRGSNPIWVLVNLQGKLFDDTYYMFVLENTIPYLPETVYHDPDMNVAWTNPIQFLANGTLPTDVFFNPTKVYRLEFRQGPTQADPLIYEVNDYVPGDGGGDIPINDSFSSNNQITNPQFSLISFESPFTFSGTNPDPIEVAPGWFLELSGTGTVTLTQVPLNNASENPTNAPYALEINLTGWNAEEVFLRQRFQQNGMLWANKTVSSAVTARVQGSFQSLSATLVDSNNSTLAQVLNAPTVIDTFVEYTGPNGDLPESTNPDLPPVAYIDYKLMLPSNTDIYLTSFQLIVQDNDNLSEPSFEQESIDRQIDHTFHYYKDSMLRQSKDSLLTGWDFGLNPWQFRTAVQTNLATFGYTADQTIAIQQAYVAGAVGNNVSVGRAAVADNYGFTVQAVTANNQFAIIQYIDAATIRSSWGSIVSSLVRLTARKQGGGALRMKMRLIHRASLPPTLSQTQPISSWAALGAPVFAAGWTEIAPKNDPVYSLANGFNELLFESFELPVSSNADMTLGIVLYTLDSMVQTGPADNIIFDQVSLAQSDFAIETTKLTFDETLARCRYYYEKSYAPSVAVGTATSADAIILEQAPIAGIQLAVGAIMTLTYYFNQNGFTIQYKNTKRTTPSVTIYSTLNANAPDSITAYLAWIAVSPGAGTGANTIDASHSVFWSVAGSGREAINYQVVTAAIGTTILAGPAQTVGGASQYYASSSMSFHYTADARLGLVA